MTDTPSIRDLLVGLAADEILVGDGEDTPYGYQETGRLWRVCAPKPVPAPPATERVPWHEGMGRIAQAPNDGDWFTIDTVRCDYILGGPVVEGDRCTLPADDDGMVEVLVDPAPTGDDEPTDTTVIRGLTRRFDGEPQADTPAPECDFGCDDEKGTTECLIHYPQADTPAPRWVVDGDGDLAFLWSKNVRMTVTRNDLGWVDDAGWDALVDLVRRDGTAPTVDLTPLFAAFDTYEASDTQPWRDQYRADVLAAVRALRDGGTR